MLKLTAYLLLLSFCFQLSCSRMGSSIPPPPPPDPCAAGNIVLNGTVTNPSVTGAGDGTINVSATGGTNFKFRINSGAWQSSSQFSNLPAGNYTVTARSGEGCVTTIDFLLSNPVPSCSSVVITISTTATGNIPCEPVSASIHATVSGGVAPYTYSIDGGSFQALNAFYNLSTGGHTIMAKDANGCMGSASTTIINQPAGPLFQQVKAIIQNRCLYCHSNASPGGGISYALDCSIVDNKARIKARAVDGLPTPMPQTGLIPAAERQKIIDWLNAGGTFSN